MVLPFHNPVQGRIDAFPFGEELLEHGFAIGGQDVKALVALVFLAPFSREQALRLQAAQEGIQSTLFDCHAVLGERLAKGVAILLGTELGEDGEDEGAAAKLEAKVLEEIGLDGHAVQHPLYATHCTPHSISGEVFFPLKKEKRRSATRICLQQAGFALHYKVSLVESTRARLGC